MSRIRVKFGRGGHNLGECIARSKPGDVILLPEGHYAVEHLDVQELSFAGVGERDKVVLQTQLRVRRKARVSDLTLVAPAFKNALHLSQRGASVEVDNVLIQGEPTAQYPAVWAAEGTSIVLRDSTIFHRKDGTGLNAENAESVQAERSGLGRLLVSGSRVSLHEVTVFTLTAMNGARISSSGALRVLPPEGKRSLVLHQQSVLSAQTLVDDTGGEGYCNESVLRIGTVRVPEGRTYTVHTTGRCAVEGGGADLSVVDDDAPATAPEPEPGPVVRQPQVVRWRAADAHRFSEAVAPLLAPGDTVLLDEGEYFLDTDGGFWNLDTHVAGRGRPEATVLHGWLGVIAGVEVELSNLTIEPTVAHNALFVGEGSLATLTNVVLVPAPVPSESAEPETEDGDDGEGTTQPPRYPALFVDASRVVLREVRVEAAAADAAPDVVARNEARLEAEDSSLGWVQFDSGSTGTLHECEGYSLWAYDAAVIEVPTSFDVLANAADKRPLVSSGSARLSLGSVRLEADDAEMLADDAVIDLGEVLMPAEGRIAGYLEHGGHIEGVVVGMVMHDLDADETWVVGSSQPGAPAPADEVVAAGSAGPQGDVVVGDGSDGAHASSEEEPTGSTSDRPAQPTAVDTANDPLAELEALTGLEKVKSQIRQFTQLVEFNRRREAQGLKTTGQSMHSLFLGNPGTGKTTVARLLGRLLYAAGAISSEVFVEVGRADLVSENIGGSAKLTRSVLESARGGVLFIDEAYSLYQERNNEFAQEAVNEILAFMENQRDQIVVIFAGYEQEMTDFLAMNPGLASRTPNRFDFEDYTAAELAQIGLAALAADDYLVDEEAYRAAVRREHSRSADESNGRWVRNLNERLQKIMVDRLMSEPADDAAALSTITAEDILRLAGHGPQEETESVEELLEQLEGLIGLAPVKDWARELVHRVELDARLGRLNQAGSRPNYHLVFTGNPGTGKTTVARILAKLLHRLGVLQFPTVREVDRSVLVGSYIGHTEKNTTRAIDAALGGVLFVDEAYQLTVEHSPNDFGQQAVETMITRLENDRDKFVAIFAGYTEDMNRFLAANEGLRSRLPTTVEFPDLSAEEVGLVAAQVLAKRWEVNEVLARDVAAGNYAALAAEDRSNGRWARTFAERVEAAYSRFVATHEVRDEDLLRIPDEVVLQFSIGHR